MIENIIHILGGLLQGTGIEESSCLVYICSRFGEHITERVGIVSCKEVEAIKAVIIKPFQYLTKHCTSAVDSSYKLICELFIVKKIASELRYVPEYIIKADNAVCVLGDFSPYALVITAYGEFSLLLAKLQIHIW